ncbi:MAG: peptidyl-tRNA hydrolase, partial [Candidatus Sungbacteria bacterium]|nr:peptidyl-tRNA hydrolase [Candidatus Sungbacteria bacterium]
KKVALALPETFMNNSGKSASVLIKYFKVKPEQIVVLHDDADIEFGNTKLSFNRSAAGHRGVEGIKRALKTEKFWRVRIGIQRKKRVDAMKLVLQKFKGDEDREIKKIMKKVGEGLELLLSDGPEHAMNFINQN